MTEDNKCKKCGRKLTSLEIEYNAEWCIDCEKEDEEKSLTN